MNKKTSSFSFGPGASSLILIFVVLCMTVLGMLSLLAARNDRNMSARSLEVVQAQYQLNQKAEECRAEIDQILIDCRQNAATMEDYLEAVKQLLPDDTTLVDDQIIFSLTDGSRTLQCRLKLYDLSCPERSAWQQHSLTAETGNNSWN